MAEQFKKIYIPASEFVRAWEKEIYELTNLDYFIYLLMNSVADFLEHSFFPQQHKIGEEYLLDSHEITGLAFHIGDSVQLFFEHNCFGMCDLNCPTQLDKELTVEDVLGLGKFPEGLDFGTQSCSTKEDCLRYDLLHFVLIDAVLDFYHFDLRVTADEGDLFLQELIQAIGEHIIELIKNEGHTYLLQPRENASPLFENLLASDDSTWNTNDLFADDDMYDPDEPVESWKISSHNLEDDLQNFKAQLPDGPETKLPIAEQFVEFVTTYIGALELDDIFEEDLKEFLLTILPRELAMSSESWAEFTFEEGLFAEFLRYLDYEYETSLVEMWKQLIRKYYRQNYEETIEVMQEYHRRNSYLEFQISKERNHPALQEGFFEIGRKYNDTLYLVRDIHINEKYLVDLSAIPVKKLKKGLILQMTIVPHPEESWWVMVWAETLYLNDAKEYLI